MPALAPPTSRAKTARARRLPAAGCPKLEPIEINAAARPKGAAATTSAARPKGAAVTTSAARPKGAAVTTSAAERSVAQKRPDPRPLTLQNLDGRTKPYFGRYGHQQIRAGGTRGSADAQASTRVGCACAAAPLGVHLVGPSNVVNIGDPELDPG